jgi:hypothetical protein
LKGGGKMRNITLKQNQNVRISTPNGSIIIGVSYHVKRPNLTGYTLYDDTPQGVVTQFYVTDKTGKYHSEVFEIEKFLIKNCSDMTAYKMFTNENVDKE